MIFTSVGIYFRNQSIARQHDCGARGLRKGYGMTFPTLARYCVKFIRYTIELQKQQCNSLHYNPLPYNTFNILQCNTIQYSILNSYLEH